jgi:ribA/ribD-fused uncharacterized protein
MEKIILFDEQGLSPSTPYEKGQWKEIALHDDFEIRGFFGDYRFLSNFWPVKVYVDDVLYFCVENAYQAAKYPIGQRKYFETCTPREAILYVRDHELSESSVSYWDLNKIEVMEKLLKQKFDPILNKELYILLQETGDKFLEETNYWGDIFWGVNKSSVNEEGKGENNLGKLLMKIRALYKHS